MTAKKAASAVPEDPDSEWMAKAVAAGQKGYPSPNPHVGAVVVKGREVLAMGHHERAGEVIPEVVRVVPELRPEGATPFRIPAECPSCGTPVVRPEGEAVTRCVQSRKRPC